MTNPEPELQSLDDCAKLLGVPVGRLHGELRASLERAASASGRRSWTTNDVYGWAVAELPETAGMIPLKHWPRATVPAAYIGGQQVGQSAVALGWMTRLGEFWLAWNYPPNRRATHQIVAAAIPSASSVAIVGGDFGRRGPSLFAALPGSPETPPYEVAWSEASGVLGQPIPYWPFTLRVPEVMLNWRPGSVTATIAAVPSLDQSPLLRLAAITEPGSPAQQTLVNLALTWQTRATENAQLELKFASERARPNTLTVAATPLEVRETTVDDLDEATRRAGWLEVLGRQDNLAVLCVRAMMMWDGGSDFPSSSPEIVDVRSSHGQEWAARLVPAPRTAIVEVLDPDHMVTEVLVDPETDAPAIRRRDGSLLAAMPQRLSTLSPLAEVILDKPIWVRTEDGVLYPAPQGHYYGTSWGYSGSGPGTLALLIDRLLDDITARAADDINGAPPGLERLTSEKWPKGTVLTRAQLEAARRD